MDSSKTPFARRFGRFVLRYRWLVIAVNALLLAWIFSAMGRRVEVYQAHVAYMRQLRDNPLAVDPAHKTPPPLFNGDYHIWFDKKDPLLADNDRFEKIFAKEDILIVAATSKSGEIFTNANLAALRALTDSLWSVPYVSRVDGLANFNYTYSQGDDLRVEDFLTGIPYTPAALSEKRATALSDSVVSKFFVSKDAAVTQIMLRVIAPPDFPEAHAEARARAEALLASVGAASPDLEYKLGGTVMLNTAFSEFAERDSKKLVPFMFLFIIAVLAFLLRSFWATAIPVGILFTSILFPICLFVGAFGFSLTNVNVTSMQILVSVAIADSVHMLTIFFQQLRAGHSREEAVIATVEKNLVPCFVTWFNTAVGFYTLIWQGIPPFADLGLFAGTGTLYAFLATIATLPALLSFIPWKVKPAKAGTDSKGLPQWPIALVDWVDAHKKAICYSSLGLTLASIALIFVIRVDNNSVHYFGKHTSFRKSAEYIDARISGTMPFEYGFSAGEANGIYSPAFLKKVERFQTYLASHPDYHFTHVTSIVDVVKRLNQTMHGGDPGFYRIPDRDSVTAEGDTLLARNLIAQYLLLYTLSLPQGMDLTNQISLDNGRLRVTAFQTNLNSSRQLEIAKEIDAWIRAEMPETEARSLGAPLIFANLMGIAIPGMILNLIGDFAIITLILLVTFRSFKSGIVSLIPNVWPIFIVYGIMGLSQYMVNLSVTLVGIITLGIAVDDTVHFMLHYNALVRAGEPRKSAIVKTLQEEGTAIIFTSLILIAGFSVLMLSEFAINVDLGMWCTSVWALALLAEFILLPATLLYFDKPAPGTPAPLAQLNTAKAAAAQTAH
ncbi:MAG TPA: MMPL family transporter [Fibrobacteria bacterium]|nr:MMPL family transporter [Fibrobacteria bacterium]